MFNSIQSDNPTIQSMDIKKILETCVSLSAIEDLDLLAKKSIKEICIQFNADYGKLLQRDQSDKSITSFMAGYAKDQRNYWTSNKRSKCQVPILSLDKQKTIDRNLRSLVGDAISTSTPHFIDDINTYEYKDFFLTIEHGIKSEVIAPLCHCHDTETNYALCLGFKNKQLFTEENKELIQKYCTLLSTFIERLLRQKQIEQVNSFQKILLKINKQSNTSKAIHQLALVLKDKIKAKEIGVYFFSADGRNITYAGGSNPKFGSLLTDNFFKSVSDLQTDENINGFFSLKNTKSIICKQGTQFIAISDPYTTQYSRKIGFMHIIYSGTCARDSGWCSYRKTHEPCPSPEPLPSVLEAIDSLKSFLLRKQNKTLNNMRLALKDINFGEHILYPIQSLQTVFETMPYFPCHLWIYDEKLRLLSLELSSQDPLATKKELTINIDDQSQTLVGKAFKAKKCMTYYGDINKSAKFKEIIPLGTYSWIGYPVFINEQATSPFAIISCFEKNKQISAGSLLSIIEEPNIIMLSIFVGLFQRLHLALKERVGRQAVLSHELKALLQLMLSDEEILYNRLIANDPKSEKGIGGRKKSVGTGTYLPRTHATLHKNINTCMDGIKLELRREEFMSDSWKPKLAEWTLHDIIAEIVALVRSLVSRRTWVTKKLEILYDEMRHIVINMDKQAFMRALLNILINAVKYGTDTTTVKITCEDRGFLYVSNYGIGILEDDEDKIFDKKFQGANAKEASSKFASPGEETFTDQGIGLFVAKEIMMKMDGDILLANPGRNGDPTIFAIKFNQKSIKRW